MASVRTLGPATIALRKIIIRIIWRSPGRLGATSWLQSVHVPIPVHPRSPLPGCNSAALLLIVLSEGIPPLSAREKDSAQYGEGLIVNVPFPETEVSQAVEDVVQNGIIRGSKEYNKDEYITGAKALTSSRAFPAWTDGGKVFYKVRTQRA